MLRGERGELAMTENDIESTGSKKAAGRYLRVWPTKAIQDHIDPRHGCYTELRVGWGY